MTWLKFQTLWMGFMVVLIAMEVWRCTVAWNWHAFIDAVLLIGFTTLTYKVIQIAKRLGL